MKSYVIHISIVAALGGLLFGFDTAVISGTINFIQPYFGLSEAGLGWTVSSLLFGCIGGVMLAGKAGDHYGRKKVLMLSALLFFISAVGSASSHSLSFFLIARVLGGIAVGVASILSPMYIVELAPAKYRGTLVSLNQLVDLPVKLTSSRRFILVLRHIWEKIIRFEIESPSSAKVQNLLCHTFGA